SPPQVAQLAGSFVKASTPLLAVEIAGAANKAATLEAISQLCKGFFIYFSPGILLIRQNTDYDVLRLILVFWMIFLIP
ncbi:MAG: hypothetical protein QX196_14565, partial [Methylococcaceae bacterium]